MSNAPRTFTTKDWLGDGMITSFPIPSETQSLSSANEEDDVLEPDTDELFDEAPETDQQEAQVVG